MKRLSISVAEILPPEKESKFKSIAKTFSKYVLCGVLGFSLLSVTTNFANYKITKDNLSKIEKDEGIFYAKLNCGNNLEICQNTSFLSKYLGGGIGLRKASEEYLEYHRDYLENYKEMLENPFKIV